MVQGEAAVHPSSRRLNPDNTLDCKTSCGHFFLSAVWHPKINGFQLCSVVQAQRNWKGAIAC